MKVGRTIVIEVNIEGPRWQADFNEELRHLLNHVDSSVHMWGDDGWQQKTLLGTDRKPTGLMRLHHGYVIGALPSDDDSSGPPEEPPPAAAAPSEPAAPGSAKERRIKETALSKLRKLAGRGRTKTALPDKATPKSAGRTMVSPDAVTALPLGTPKRAITPAPAAPSSPPRAVRPLPKLRRKPR